MKPDRLKVAIQANIDTMQLLVDDAAQRITEAAAAIEKGQQNQAIGTILDVDTKLENALALYRATIALHRAARS